MFLKFSYIVAILLLFSGQQTKAPNLICRKLTIEA